MAGTTNIPRKLMLSLAASAMVLGLAAPALAGGDFHGSITYSTGYGGYYPAGHGYYRPYPYRSYHRPHHHGGDGAAIALGVLGGVILLNELAESNARARADAYYGARYNRYSAPRYSDPVIYPDDDYYGDAPADGALSDDYGLEGGANDGGPAPIRLSSADAYNACMVHARAALSERGYIFAAPSEPETAEDAGRFWKMTANVTTSDGRGGEWTRAMYCEAVPGRVLLLELK